MSSYLKSYMNNKANRIKHMDLTKFRVGFKQKYTLASFKVLNIPSFQIMAWLTAICLVGHSQPANYSTSAPAKMTSMFPNANATVNTLVSFLQCSYHPTLLHWCSICRSLSGTWIINDATLAWPNRTTINRHHLFIKSKDICLSLGKILPCEYFLVMNCVKNIMSNSI